MSDQTINVFVQFIQDGQTQQSYEDIRAVFRIAESQGSAVRFIYQPTADQYGQRPPQVRTVSAVVLNESQDGLEYITAHDHDREHARAFSLDRVLEAERAPDVVPYG